MGPGAALTGAGRPPSAAEPAEGASVVARGEAGRPAVENLQVVGRQVGYKQSLLLDKFLSTLVFLKIFHEI